MNIKEKLNFIFVFIITYTLLLLLGIYVFGNTLLGFEENLIHLVLGNFVNYSNFSFVVYCSGIVSMAAYLGVIAGFLAIRLKILYKVVIANIIVLWLINLFRIIAVMLSDTIGLTKIIHIFSWFFMAIIIIWMIEITVKGNRKKK